MLFLALCALLVSLRVHGFLARPSLLTTRDWSKGTRTRKRGFDSNRERMVMAVDKSIVESNGGPSGVLKTLKVREKKHSSNSSRW